MAKVVVAAGRAFRVIAKRKNSLAIQPLDTENPHAMIFRLPGRQPDAGWWLSEHRGEKRTPLIRIDDYTFDLDRDRFKK